MALYNWNSSYSVNVQRCDDDHKKLFASINKLYEAMQSGAGGTVIEKVLEELEHYTRYHFSGEEALMAKAKYPALATHRLQHRKFVEKVAKIRKDGVTGKSIEVLAFLNDWLIQHIQRSDQQYSAHLNAHGIS